MLNVLLGDAAITKRPHLRLITKQQADCACFVSPVASQAGP